ncbi:hypothetical protein [Aquihabitans sp. McL0605]|uniref:hypothetical protein n=1 Tax=Aquihabitans sp. McL0605 TaxID=3415671 RepID=UPI003CED318F
MDPVPSQPTADEPSDGDAAAAGSAEAAGPAPKTGALRQRATALTDQAKKLQEDSRATIPPVDIGFSALERDNHIGGFLLAGAIAFRLFVYLLPMYLLALVIAGAAFAFDPDDPSKVANSAGMSSYLSQSIGDAAKTSHKSLWLLIPVTLYAVVSAGLSVHKAIASSHSRAWGLPAVPKSKPHYVALGVLVFSLVVLGVSRFLSVIRHGPLLPVAMVIGAAIYTGLWVLASRGLPRAPGANLWALVPGAILVGAGTQGLYLFNVLYLNRKIESASAAYGALGVAASALLWLYLLGRLMVAAPVLNSTLWHRKHDPGGGLGVAGDEPLAPPTEGSSRPSAP